ncbi:hypothetical protein [Microbacterium sp. 18062]|uniref:hypothetical protein n=1 Tax=Microbacterium sp. 18062 TaxID=2681410 RepID=UPI00135BA972|nr:hypothetical protein [Microbacterium sp. 18062]
MSPFRAYADLRGVRPRQVLRMIVGVWWAAATSGRFFTWWSAGVSFVVSVTILGAYVRIDRVSEYFPAIGVSAISWVLLLIAMLPVAWGERRLRSATARGVLVVAALVAVSVVRPLLNDSIGQLLVPGITGGGWPQRIVTNLLVWTLLLSLVAIATVGYGSTQAVNVRLRAALISLAAAEHRAEAFDRDARVALQTAVDELRLRLRGLTSSPLGFDDVRIFSEAVRAASHDLDDVAHDRLGDVVADAPAVVASPEPAPRPFLTRLRPPPVLSVALMYILASLPYTLQAAPLPLVLVSTALALVLGSAADIVSRRVARRRPAVRGAVLVIAWIVVGILFSIAAHLLLPSSGMIALIPLIAFPGAAVVTALSADAIRRSIVQARKLTRALADEAGALSTRTARTRELLRDAADQLHGHVQGRCVVFAAALDERDATAEEAREFGITIERALDTVLAPPPHVVEASNELGDTLAVWAHVLEITSVIDPRTESALADDDVSRRVSDIASEGFLNAVKHSGARRAELLIGPGARAGRSVLRIEVVSPGVLASGLHTHGRGIANLGGDARVYQRGGDVVLDASVAVPSSVSPPPSGPPSVAGAASPSSA